MLRKLLLSLLLIISSQVITAQAPGADCTVATPLTLIPGATISTGLQSTLGLGNTYDATVSCGIAGFYGPVHYKNSKK